MGSIDAHSPPTARLAQVAAHFNDAEKPNLPVSAPGTAPGAAPAPATATAAGPSLILIFGWTGAPRSSLERFATEYAKIYPKAETQLFPVDYIDFLPRPARSAAQTARGFDKLLAAVDAADGNVLVHLFSGGGATRLAMLASLYRRERGRALPARVLLCDSAPSYGGVLLRARVLNDQIAFAESPWLVKEFTRPAFVIGLAAAYAWTAVTGQADFTQRSWEGLLGPELVPREATRGYVYSMGDVVVRPDEVERHISLARERGLDVEVEKYADSSHVGHAKQDPERYWGFVRRLWEKSGKGRP